MSGSRKSDNSTLNIHKEGAVSKQLNNDLTEQFIKFKRSRTSYLGKITQNINKINYHISLRYKLEEIKELLYELENYQYKIKVLSQDIIESTNDENETKAISDKVTEHEFCIIQIKKSVESYKNNSLLFKNCDVISTTSKSSSGEQNSLPGIKEVAKTETKSNSNFSSTSASNFLYFELHGIQYSPNYFKISRENNEMKPEKRLELLEKQFEVAKTIILSETRQEDLVLESFTKSLEFFYNNPRPSS